MARRRSDDAIEQAEFVTVGELARITGIRYSSLKFYTEQSLLEFSQDDSGLTRRYRKEDAIRRLNEIQELKSKGCSISEIKEKLK